MTIPAYVSSNESGKNKGEFCKLFKSFKPWKPKKQIKISDSDREWDSFKSSIGADLKGQLIDVISLLSNNGKTKYLVSSNGKHVDFDVLRRKHVIICCLIMPALFEITDYDNWWPVFAAYSDLMTNKGEHVDGVEMVVVANIDNKADFDLFFSALPCLAIPFSEFETRDYVCSFLHSRCSTLVVDPSGIVLHHSLALHYFQTYGSQGFPFTDINLEAIKAQDKVMRARLDPFYDSPLINRYKAVMEDPFLRNPLSLHEDILQCPPNRILTRFGSVSGPDQQLSVSQLNSKYVGLYLCLDGHFMELLNKAHRHCIANNQELEIVLVYVSHFYDPKSFKENVTRNLESCNITSWFILEDSKVGLRLWRAFGEQWDEDKLIILPPNCKSGELEGKAVITQLGIEEYPFTRTSILERRSATLRPFTAKFWFNGTTRKRTCLYCNGRKCKVRHSEIKHKKLLLYFDWPFFNCDNGKLCRRLMKHYTEIKDNGWEVVFVPSSDDSEVASALFYEMPWPIMPFYAAAKYSVKNQLLFNDDNYKIYNNPIVALDRTRRVLSTQVGERLKRKGLHKFLSKYNRLEELAESLGLLEDP